MERGVGIDGYFYKFGLGAAERHLVVHDLIFDGIAQRSVEQYPDFTPSDETHLKHTFSEGTVAHYLDNRGFLARF